MWRTPFPLSATNVAKVIKVAESQNEHCQDRGIINKN